MIYNPSEPVVLLDESANPIGTMPKNEIHGLDTPLHLAFSIFLFNTKGQMLVQQRALSKTTFPGIWSNACCGHPLPNEPLANAAKRRLSFELGLEDIQPILALPSFRYKALYQNICENEICPVFIGRCSKEPNSNPLEVESTDWIDWQEFSNAIDDPEPTQFDHYSPWSVLEARELKQSPVFHNFLSDLLGTAATHVA